MAWRRILYSRCIMIILLPLCVPLLSVFFLLVHRSEKFWAGETSLVMTCIRLLLARSFVNKLLDHHAAQPKFDILYIRKSMRRGLALTRVENTYASIRLMIKRATNKVCKQRWLIPDLLLRLSSSKLHYSSETVSAEPSDGPTCSCVLRITGCDRRQTDASQPMNLSIHNLRRHLVASKSLGGLLPTFLRSLIAQPWFLIR